MSRLICVNLCKLYDLTLPSFIEFNDFETYLQKFGINPCADVPVWRVEDLLNPDGSIDFRLIARPCGWTSEICDYWSNCLCDVLERGNMSTVYVPSLADLGDNLLFIYESINARISCAIDTHNLDLYNDAVADMQKFCRKYLGCDYV